MSAKPKTYRVHPGRHSPDEMQPVDDEFTELYRQAVEVGRRAASSQAVCFVGMARDIAGVLPFNLTRLEALGSLFRDWSAVVVENDSTDGTKQVLAEWQERHGSQVIVDSRDLGRERLSGFEAARVERYAEYRTRYRDLAAESFGNVDLVIAVDLDPWGGWSPEGVLNGVGWMTTLPRAAGMASVSLYQQQLNADGQDIRLVCHYDAWAWRAAYSWRHRIERHFALWLPPVGSPPIPCNSAFGALCIYRAAPFFKHAPVSIDGDIEHVGLHRAMADDGWEFFINPSQRTLMHWLPDESDAVTT